MAGKNKMIRKLMRFLMACTMPFLWMWGFALQLSWMHSLWITIDTIESIIEDDSVNKSQNVLLYKNLGEKTSTSDKTLWKMEIKYKAPDIMASSHQYDIIFHSLGKTRATWYYGHWTLIWYHCHYLEFIIQNHDIFIILSSSYKTT